MRKTASSSILCHSYVCFYLALLTFYLGGANAMATLVSRAIIRPIPMPGFEVSVFDDITGAPIPQVQASDGGGLVDGRVFSAPNVIWAISAAVTGSPLGIAGVRLWRVTTALGGGLVLAFAMWVAIVNTISENGLVSSQSMSDMLILLITGGAFLVGMISGAFRIIALPAMAATCVLGGASVAVRGVILRPGLLVSPGPNEQLAFVNIVIVAVGALCGGLSVIFKQRESMIFSTSCIGSFLVALSVDLLVNGQNGMSRGLRFLFDMNDNHLADLVGGGYNPPLSTQIIVAGSLGLTLILCTIQHFAFPGPFQRPQPRKRTESITDLASAKGTPSYPQASVGRVPVAPGPIWRTSVLSLFRVPGRSSSQQMAELGIPPPGKPSNERRGSSAYNYGQGIYALPSELLRQQSQPRSPSIGSPRLNLQRPPVLATRDQPPQFTGIGLRSYQVPLIVPHNNNQFYNPKNPPLGVMRHGGARATPPSMSQGTDARFNSSRNAASQTLAIPRTGGGPKPVVAGDSIAASIPRFPAPKIISPPSAAAIAPLPRSDAVAPSTPRMRIGMGMLRMSVDSIIDAYGGTSDTGYRYGGSRTGEGGKI